MTKQIFPSTITGATFAEGGSVLDHRFGAGEPYTLGVEETSKCESSSEGARTEIAQRPDRQRVMDAAASPANCCRSFLW